MSVIDAVMTDIGLDLTVQHWISDIASVQFSYFKIGEGGFVESGAVKTPKTPNPILTRLEADGVALSGSVTFANGSPNVSGSGTDFVNEINVGQYIRLDDDLVWAQVQSITDANNLVLTGNYTGTGGSGSGAVITTPYYVFRKNFIGTDLTFEGSGVGSAVAFLDFTEGNDDGFGSSPEFFEIGLFDAADNMIAYGTYPGETKTNLIQFNKVCRTALTRG